MAIATKTIRTKIPARMDRLPWSRWHWLVVFALGTVWILDGLEVTIKGAVGPALRETLGFTTVRVAASASIYLFGAITGALFWGYMTDRFGRQKLLILTLATYMVGVVGTTLAGLFSFAFITPYIWFAVFRFITGFGIGGEYAAINSAIDELIPARVRGWVDLVINGSWWIGTAVAAGAAVFLLTYLPDGLAWRIAFGLGGVIAVAILMLRIFVPESPRWLMTHGRPEEAERIVREIESDVKDTTGVDQLREPGDDEAIELRERESIGFLTLGKTVFRLYPNRSIAGGGILLTQAFLYNAIFFTFGLMLTQFFGVPTANVGLFLIPFAAGNFLGPLILGKYFDEVGRKIMIPLTFALAGSFTVVTGFLFWQGWIGSAVWITIAWVVIFFFASAGASAGYLTVSETFPLEIRAMAIAFFYALATGIGGITGPILFGNLIATDSRQMVFYGYLIGGGVMILGGVIHRIFGVEAAQMSLEDVTMPLSAAEGGEGEERETFSGPGGVDPTDEESVRAFQREHGLTVDGVVGAQTVGALRALAGRGGSDGDDAGGVETVAEGRELTVVDIADMESIMGFQRTYGLSEYGEVGPETRGAIRAAELRGILDAANPASVKDFQRSHDLEETGIVDAETQAALQAIRAERARDPDVGGEAYLDFDPLDPESVKRFQRECGLRPTGDVDRMTQGALLVERARRERSGGVDPADPESVKRFQAERGLRETGLVDEDTQRALRRVREELGERRPQTGFFRVDPTDPESIRRFQQEHGLNADGVIGGETRRALRRERHRLQGLDPTDAESIKRFQREHGLRADGVIGPETQGALRALKEQREPVGIEEEDDDEREQADEAERERSGVLDFDPADASSVRRFQEEHGLEPDGVVGRRTQAALRAVLEEREIREIAEEERPPERVRRAPSRGRPHVSGFMFSAHVPEEDRELQHELDELLRLLRERGSMSKRELREESGARLWGPGRFRYVLRTAEEEGVIRRTGRDRYAAA